MRRKQPSKRLFTLLEISLSIAILALVGGVLTWQIRTMLFTHEFRASVDTFSADLRRGMLIALSKGVDLRVEIGQDRKGYWYAFTSDEPIERLPKERLRRVEKIVMKGQTIESETLTIYHSGWVVPQARLLFRAMGEEVDIGLHLRDKESIVSNGN